MNDEHKSDNQFTPSGEESPRFPDERDTELSLAATPISSVSDLPTDAPPAGSDAAQNCVCRPCEDALPEARQPGPPTKSGTRRAFEEAVDWAKSIAVALVLALLIKAFLVQAYVIPTGSMQPTIEPGDRIFGNRLTYRFNPPGRGDIIAFIPPPAVYKNMNIPIPGGNGSHFSNDEDNNYSYLKRTIAVEGDMVGVFGGKVYLNGKMLDEPYLKNGRRACPGYEDFTMRVVPEGMVLALGDNRCNSHDGHKWGFLPRENVQAKAFFRFWPPNRIGVVR